MTSGLVINIEHGEEKRTEVFTRDFVRIGHAADSDLRLPPDASAAFDLEIERNNGHYRVARVAAASKLLLNDAPLLAGAIIHDADEVRAPESNLRLRFYPIGMGNAIVARPTGELDETLAANFADVSSVRVAPFIEHAAIEAAATARRDDAKVFLREFTRELVREISPLTKILTLLVVVALISGLTYFPYVYYKELQRARMESEAMRQQLIAMRTEMGATSSEIKQLGDKNSEIVSILSVAPHIVAKYSAGVCIIAGTYQWYDSATNRPLRHRVSGIDEDGVPLPAEEEGEGATLTPDGDGAIAQYDFVGTGFHVGGGYILTNRHVAARPWEADQRSQYLTGTVPARARVTRLLAFFPNRRQPVVLRLRATHASEDLAVCTTDARDGLGNIPVLPLDADANASNIGNDVVMIGYPSGPDRLLALLPEAQSRTAQMRYGDSLEGLFGYLASQQLIRPLTTRGTITDLPPRRIVYDARTAEGGSGAPLFGQSARVIGVNFAVLPSNSASNFAVPVRFARELLARTGWRSPEIVAEADAAKTAAADQTNTQTPATRSLNAPGVTPAR